MADPTFGLRTWRLRDTDDGFRLSSPMIPAVWPARDALAARCVKGCLIAGGSGCRCGVHAWKVSHAPDGWEHETTAYGLVSLWGRVSEHRLGFRAELAYPRVVLVHADAVRATLHRRGRELDPDEVVAELAGVYGVEVRLAQPRVSRQARPASASDVICGPARRRLLRAAAALAARPGDAAARAAFDDALASATEFVPRTVAETWLRGSD